MSNILDNGTVLPFGLLGSDNFPEIVGFNKSYRNFPVRLGIISECYPVDHKNNMSKLSNEYEVLVFEQQEDNGTAIVTYRNCLCADSFGSIPDFLEKTLRKKTRNDNSNKIINTKNQNGSIVLLMCLDGVSEKAIILGGMTHPDRKTTLVDEGPRLEGEYNGINIKIEKDGSTALTFRGSTDSDGQLIDPSQGNTTISIEKDGSFQVNHDKITQRLDRNGKASLTAKDNISNTTEKNFNVSAKENINLKAEKDFLLDCVKLTANASGMATISAQGMEINSQSAIKVTGSNLTVEAKSLAMIKSPTITLDGFVSLGGKGGQPVLLLTTVFYGTGNIGAPVISTPIFGFANKVTGQ